MKVHLLSAYNVPVPDFGPSWVRDHAVSIQHEIIDDPAQADIIIFVEALGYIHPYFFEVLRHPVYRRFKHKSVLYHINDTAHTLCRTLSPSVERGQPNLATRRSFHYISRIRDNDSLQGTWDIQRTPKFMFSFVGDPDTHPVRKKILALSHARAFLSGSSGGKADHAEPEVKKTIEHFYIDSILNSHFVLCPRGYGPTSMRLFEVMQMGRVPVIIGDSWIPVPDIEWNSFAVFVPESAINSIPELLQSLMPQAADMGAKARMVWLQKFSPECALDELVSAAESVLKAPLGLRQKFFNWLEFARFCHWRNLFGYLKCQYIKR